WGRKPMSRLGALRHRADPLRGPHRVRHFIAETLFRPLQPAIVVRFRATFLEPPPSPAYFTRRILPPVRGGPLHARTLIGGAFGALALGLVAFVAFTGNGRAYFGQGQSHPLYRIAAVDRGLIQAEVHATGTLRPRITVPVVSQTTGVLREVLVAENAVVK